MTTGTLSRLKSLYSVAEHLIGPLLVFVICYAHHLYFAEDFVSSFFAAFCLLSLLLVMALNQTGLLLGLAIQIAFLGWVTVAEPLSLTEQMLFSSSISLALIASYFNKDPIPVAGQQIASQQVATNIDAQALTEQKEKLWQELFDARQEIKSLYQQKQEVEASIPSKVAEAVYEKEEKILFLQHHLEAALIEKSHFVEDRAACETDIQKLGSHMHEMALYQETLRQEILRLEELREKEKKQNDKKHQEKLPEQHQKQLQEQLPEQLKTDPPPQQALDAPTDAETKDPEARPSHYEAMYRQLKEQFEEKQKTLEEARKELFFAQDEIEILKKTQNEALEATPEEKHLMYELAAIQDKLDALNKAHDEELVGYEEVIQGLLNQLQDHSR